MFSVAAATQVGISVAFRLISKLNSIQLRHNFAIHAQVTHKSHEIGFFLSHFVRVHSIAIFMENFYQLIALENFPISKLHFSININVSNIENLYSFVDTKAQ